MNDIIITNEKQLKKVMAEIREADRANPERLFTIPETARKLERPYKTILRMVKRGAIKTTADGQFITQQAINNYLNINNIKITEK